MNTIQQTAHVTVAAPVLPKGGGALRGMGETLGEVGVTGQASLSLPLPISAGRGYAPALALSYSSDRGNSAFGLGWQVALMSISRDTRHGAPHYDERDAFLDPGGEPMVPERDEQGRVVSRSVSAYGALALGATYQVTRYLPRVMQSFERIERWQVASGDFFWLIHGIDGQLHCLGKDVSARIADPLDTARTGRWLVQESVSPGGEHIRYHYTVEDSAGVDLSGAEAARSHTANRYLAEVCYGNREEYLPLYAWNAPDRAQPEWLFRLMFDYGSRITDVQQSPGRESSAPWPCRADSFSDYSLGFEVRTHRLCQQILMFHHFPETLQSPDTLVRCLQLTHRQTPQVSQLIVAQTLAYEPDGTLLSMPPLELDYAPFDPQLSTEGYQSLPAFAGLNNGHPWQLVDLYGEGLPGILYQEGNDWCYRPPQRDQDMLPLGIDYGPAQRLPEVPDLQGPGNKLLMDLTGDGRLDWLILQPALNGYFTLGENQQWSNFIPWPALPAEFFHPAAQLVDVCGAGLMDLALLSPNSVRLYPNQRSVGFGGAITVAPEAGVTLPAGIDERSLVAFSDLLGSGQQHLVRIRHDSIECWPNMGNGRFGSPLQLDGPVFNARTFHPDRVFLADLDGSGAADLLYAEARRILIYRNQCGNGFATSPLILPLPEGARFDNFCQISFADLEGSGTHDLILSLILPQPRHWRFSFAATKPGLLTSINNHMGAVTRLTFYNSAQAWLDQKWLEPDTRCRLPFSFPLLSRVVINDEITGNTLTDNYRYWHGLYDGQSRELRGFGLVDHTDGASVLDRVSGNRTYASPTLTRSWYHNGEISTATELAPLPWRDDELFTLGAVRVTRYNTQSGADEDLLLTPPAHHASALRALKGLPLRTEIYNALEEEDVRVPLSVRSWRYMIRQFQPPAGDDGACLALALEQLDVCYEGIANDPVVRQKVTVQYDRYGVPLRHVALDYPRRPKPADNPYAPELPDNWWLASYDDAQQTLRLTETRQQVYHLDGEQSWRLGLPAAQRLNVISDPDGKNTWYPVTRTGLSYEALSQPDGPLGRAQVRVLAGQQVTCYFDSSGRQVLPAEATPPFHALVHHTEVAELDNNALDALTALVNKEQALQQAGYRPVARVLSEPEIAEENVWAVLRDFTTYTDAQGNWLPFSCPRASQRSEIVGQQCYQWDPTSCVVVAVTDAAGNQNTAQYDWRFLVPSSVTDANGCVQEARFDALGRVIATSFYGSEMDERGQVNNVGFSPLSAFDPGVQALSSISAALADPPGALQQAASVYLYDLFSWSGRLMQDKRESGVSGVTLWQTLLNTHLITVSGHILSRGRCWQPGDPPVPGVPPHVMALFSQTEPGPVQCAQLSGEQYPGADGQIPIMLQLSDGFGRSLQTKQKADAGEAYIVDEQGRIELDTQGVPRTADTGDQPRWAVSGRVIYNEKSEPVRVYQPYYLNQPRYVDDTDMVRWGDSELFLYDALGRQCERISAAGYRHRIRYYPWFNVEEDENDTLSELLNSEDQTGSTQTHNP